MRRAKRLTLYLPTFIRRCIILEVDGSARMYVCSDFVNPFYREIIVAFFTPSLFYSSFPQYRLFDCNFVKDGVTVHYSSLFYPIQRSISTSTLEPQRHMWNALERTRYRQKANSGSN